jgi:hypothetical protein
MVADTSTPTAKPAEIYICSRSSNLYHIGHIESSETVTYDNWRTRCGRLISRPIRQLVPVSNANLCPRCATPQEYNSFNFYLGECWITRTREHEARKKEQYAKTEARQTALRMLAHDFVDILGIYIEEVAEPEHLPGASNIKCKTSIDGHTFEFTIRIPL